MRDFPGLSHRCAREIVEGASSVEMESLTGAGRVPLALAERARWAIRDSRIDRACAGLRQAAAENDDTGKLALGLLDAIAPWSAGVNVELPAAGRGGLLQTLRRQLDSRQRQLLGISQMTDDALGERLGREALADREAAARMIGLARVGQGIRPPVRLFDGRLGYPLSGHLTGTRQALRRTLNHVFPVMSSEQLEVYLQDLAQRGWTRGTMSANCYRPRSASSRHCKPGEMTQAEHCSPPASYQGCQAHYGKLAALYPWGGGG